MGQWTLNFDITINCDKLAIQMGLVGAVSNLASESDHFENALEEKEKRKDLVRIDQCIGVVCVCLVIL